MFWYLDLRRVQHKIRDRSESWISSCSGRDQEHANDGKSVGIQAGSFKIQVGYKGQGNEPATTSISSIMPAWQVLLPT